MSTADQVVVGLAIAAAAALFMALRPSGKTKRLVLEVGKTYVTRNGNQVLVTSIDPSQTYEVTGRVTDPLTKKEVIMNWTTDGLLFEHSESTGDIVAEA